PFQDAAPLNVVLGFLLPCPCALEEFSSYNSRLLKVTISKSPPVSAILGSSITLTCLVSLAETPIAFGRQGVLTLPLVKWSVLSSGLETEILVARGGRVKVSGVYKGHASLPGYFSSSTNVTLRLEGLRYNDSGLYRCMAQQGLEDSYDQVPVKVKGVVFHYRHASGLYAFSFREAQTACEDIGARMATPAQFLAGYRGSPEPCTAGWLSDQTVRYPTQSPEDGCFGDKEKERGMWNYTVRDPSELWDVYCYVEDITGKILYSCTPQHLTFKEAEEYCQAGGATLATLAQVYAAWNDGLHHCSPGWLADGSVRYPVGDSRESCRGSTPGVKTIYRFSNQTNFPEPHSLHSVYCFQGSEIDMPETNLESGDLALLSEMTAGDSIHLPMPQTNLGSDNPITSSSVPGDNTELYKILSKTNQSVGGTDFEHSGDSSSPSDKTSEARVEGKTVTPSFTQAEITHGQQETSLLSGSPKPFFDISNEDMKYEEAMLGEFNETSGTAKSYEDMNVNSGPYVQFSDLVSTTVDSPPEGTREQLASFSPAESAVTRDKVKAEYREDNISARVEFRNIGTLPTQKTESFVTLDYVPTSKSGGSSVFSPGGCFRNPCANGGTCVEEGASAKCLCLPTYWGQLCQTDLAPCDADWQKFQGFCYRHFSNQQAWEEAEQHCRTHGGHLASVWTPEEQDFIYNNYRDYQWIGLNDKTIEGDFHWSDGSPLLYENWYNGQPDSYFLSGEDCGVMMWNDGGRWSDVPCNYHLPYVCKKGTAFCGEPPTLPNTQVFSQGHLHYEVSSMVRYYCVDGYLPRHNPVIKCLPNGQWEEPQFMCDVPLPRAL
uniref:Brevican n=1 Tax=Paramormyrops kingsleyae TaxID=1676925 RepID=A0A3B3SEF0_9TELE